MPVDAQKLGVHLSEGNTLSVLVKGHLWVERCLNRAIELRADDPSALGTDRLTFAVKLRIAQAFGAVTPEHASVIASLNAIRNRAAHRVDYDLVDDELDGLITALHGGEDEPAVPTPTDRLGFAFARFIAVLDAANVRNTPVRDTREPLMHRRWIKAQALEDGATEEEAEEAASKVEGVLFTRGDFVDGQYAPSTPENLCPACSVELKPTGRDGGPRWHCPSCGSLRL